MISGLAQILLFQGLGEILSRLLLPSIPGPVLGLVMLIGFLVIRRRVNADLESVAMAFSRYLGILFVPAAVGVVLVVPQLRSAWVAVTLALIGSLVITIAVAGLVMRLLGGDSGEGR
jgi:holin-like protein